MANGNNIRLKQAIAIVIAYVAPLWLMWSRGTPSIITAVIAGTALSGIIILGRGRYEEVFAAGAGGLMGGAIGFVWGDLGSLTRRGADAISSQVFYISVGVIAGALLMSRLTDPDTDTPPEDNSESCVKE